MAEPLILAESNCVVLSPATALTSMPEPTATQWVLLLVVVLPATVEVSVSVNLQDLNVPAGTVTLSKPRNCLVWV